VLLLSVVNKRDRGKINPEPVSRQVVGEIPDEPLYWEPICETLLRGLIQAGVVPPLEKNRDDKPKVG